MIIKKDIATAFLGSKEQKRSPHPLNEHRQQARAAQGGPARPYAQGSRHLGGHRREHGDRAVDAQELLLRFQSVDWHHADLHDRHLKLHPSLRHHWHDGAELGRYCRPEPPHPWFHRIDGRPVYLALLLQTGDWSNVHEECALPQEDGLPVHHGIRQTEVAHKARQDDAHLLQELRPGQQCHFHLHLHSEPDPVPSPLRQPRPLLPLPLPARYERVHSWMPEVREQPP